MSGYNPSWIERNHFVMQNGKKRLVQSFHFCSAPGPNNDELVVIVGGKPADFATLSPLPAKEKDLPAHIKKGELVEFEISGKTKLEFISKIWLQQKKGEKKGRVMLSFENWPFATEANKVRALSPENKERAEELIKVRQKKKEDDKRIREVVNAISKINSRNNF